MPIKQENRLIQIFNMFQLDKAWEGIDINKIEQGKKDFLIKVAGREPLTEREKQSLDKEYKELLTKIS